MHLRRMESQYQFDKTCARYMKEASSSKDNEDHVDLIEESKANVPEDGAESVSSGGTHFSTMLTMLTFSPLSMITFAPCSFFKKP